MSETNRKEIERDVPSAAMNNPPESLFAREEM
jgi:hypothetical protein